MTSSEGFAAFDLAPFTVAWEVTRACALRCIHCRAEAQPRRHPDELTTEEGLRLVDEIAEMGARVLVVTGGDPFMRRDIREFIARGKARGLRVALSPSATRLATGRALLEACEAGAEMIHISLDGATPGVHDAFRGVRGSYARTIAILGELRSLGVPLQIGTTVCRRNVHELEALAGLVGTLGASVWSVFFLVPTGRAQQADVLSPDEHERVLGQLADLAASAPFYVRTTAAPQFRRVVLQRAARGETPVPAAAHIRTGAGYARRPSDPTAAAGVNDGKGFCFVDHLGNVCPSGFLPLPAGNVREQPISRIYRESPLFRALRDPSRLEGKCGRCEFREVCGGSRARAFAFTGNPFAADPSCPYEPAASADARGDAEVANFRPTGR